MSKYSVTSKYLLPSRNNILSSKINDQMVESRGEYKGAQYSIFSTFLCLNVNNKMLGRNNQ